MGLQPRPADASRLDEEARSYLAARQELGGSLDEQLVASFVAQVRDAISAEVSRQVGQRELDSERLWKKRTELAAVTLGTGIPLLVVAALAAHLWGIIVVCAMLVLINLSLVVARR